MYKLNAIVTIDPKHVESPKTQDYLSNLEKHFLSLLAPFQVESKNSLFYYHPDEEAEMNGIYFAAKEIRLSRLCHRFRSVVCLSQIIRSVADMLDGLDHISYKCAILDPEIYEPDDEEDC